MIPMRHQMRLHPGGYGRHPEGTNLLNIAQSIRIASERAICLLEIYRYSITCEGNALRSRQQKALMIFEAPREFPSVGRPTEIFQGRCELDFK